MGSAEAMTENSLPYYFMHLPENQVNLHANARWQLGGQVLHYSTVSDIQQQFQDNFDLTNMILSYFNREKIATLATEDLQHFAQYLAYLYLFLSIPICRFQEPDFVDMHMVRCTGEKLFRQGLAHNDWVWVKTGNSDNYGQLQGHLPEQLKVLFTVIDPATGVHYQLALVIMTKADLSGHPNQQAHGHGLVTVSPCSLPGGYWIVEISSLVAIAYIVKDPYQDRWFINNRIDLWSFNQFY